MTRQTRLDITGYRAKPVPNRFMQQDGDTDRLAILLPGFGYTCDMPLFYYAENLLTDSGADVLRVEYAYNTIRGYGQLPPEEANRWLAADVAAAYQAVIGQRPYRELVLIGKSLGTMAMAQLLTSPNSSPERFAGEVRAIWLTPAFRMAGLTELMLRCPIPSLVIIGDADPHYDADALDALRATTRPEFVVIPGVDHGLDVPGDAVASVAALARAVAVMERFVGEPAPLSPG